MTKNRLSPWLEIPIPVAEEFLYPRRRLTNEHFNLFSRTIKSSNHQTT